MREVDISDPKIIFGVQQTANDESFSDTLLYQPDEFPLSPLHTLPKITLALTTTQTLSLKLELFSDPEIMNKTLKVKCLLPDNSVEKDSSSGVSRDDSGGFLNGAPWEPL